MVAAVHDQDLEAQVGRAALGDGQAEEARPGDYKINIHVGTPMDGVVGWSDVGWREGRSRRPAGRGAVR
nr:hypothetical protein GCM10010200_050710 [Actinomadura rugatobispora]